MIDLKNKLCEFDGCKYQPNYGNADNKIVRFCKSHKEENMINLKSKRCEFDSCDIQPSYGNVDDKIVRFCKSHKQENMIDLVNKLCKSNEQGIICETQANRKYKNYCARCYSYLFPNDPLSFNIRSKTFELKVKDFINASYPTLEFQHNKLMSIGGCDCRYKRFIDTHIIINGCLLAIEVDENQHKGYDDDNEEARVNDIMMVYTYPHYFIRFSPNNRYKTKDGKYQTPQFTTRLAELKKEIDKAVVLIENGSLFGKEELLTNKYMFFDE